ncbi:MAG: putative peptidoglycan lipid II flippase MurJ [Candidatus Daviesbacteria bacterium GW2011_GWB1_39_5]|uniref:Probable lipid II flippase MurJ n=1 Tax=Candidatus Daviesbacteria bacterium GW2011_GWC2_40_12 TaxID=1618431 RepID=A0A0G0T4L8_9BACT|nr:MAG: putative peptidoglycan lipid II flippase MurJ [Candidatus Daviesbacteria bacterium GW2011_GWA2_39_33]KKR23316.1 MAG: putative peptidoglycan lipid II flippase MurJ [Candidatus Daviesbacteria bacterium GW2011_GWB1_39_5]KKR42070.1 MAG: putative peptidoglycan lipid II flippase MurJ [Candidatus Daviesbacteria bacterium GW2011_GWC2_40_12]OGE20837.1 MAG: murein biosynthesis integral membrane protein MurJ [Candidatus Daviesbacteria bacterium RIFCSPHIGHO2_01_FULL_40_24]OGE28189.1 MAG: murein bio
MVKNIVRLLYSRQTSILSAASIIMATMMLSKVLGLIRDRLLAHVFLPEKIDIFWAAFRLPDLIFQIIILGALSVAFIPVFTEHLENKGKEDAFAMARAVLSVALAIFIVITVVMYIFAEPIIGSFIAPGFSLARQLQVVELTRIILFGQVILVFGSFFIGISQSFQRFIIPSLAPVFYNFGIILGIVFLSKQWGITGAAYGVVIGAFLHAAIQLPLIWSIGFRFKLPLNFFNTGVREIMRLMSVRTIGLSAEQINETVGLALASIASVGSVTFLTFAQHLQVVPIGLFGATLAQAALPVLSAERARGKIEEFKITILTTLQQILFLTLPATVILIVIRIPVVRLIFGASQFNWEATVLTGATLAFLSVGLAAQAISLLLVRGFYALKDTKTPVLVSLFVVMLNIILGVYLIVILKLDVWSIGLANSTAAIVSAVLLFWALHKKVGNFDLKSVLGPFSKMLMATIIMGASLYIPIKLLDQVIFDTTRTINLLVLTGLSSIFALSIYVAVVWFLKVRELSTYLELIKRFGRWQSVVKSKEILPETV